ncbi:MAG: ester cyclase [Thermoleophilia bacterium]|nr:ester cyclase [Thermoleophilia bacterium]
MTPEETKAYIDDFMTEIWDRGNIDKVDEYFAPNFVSRTPGPFGSDREGRRQMIHMFMDAFSEWKSDESVILRDGDLALVRWAGSAKHTGDFMGVPATGNLVCIGG